MGRDETMKRIPGLLLAACLGGLVIAMSAQAQPSDDSNVRLNAPGFLIKKPKPGLPDVKAQPLAWPRLDPGAVLCRTEADLDRLADRRRGESVTASVDCQVVRTTIGIAILQRKGPGKTEVKGSDLKGASTSGWTDAWLPDKAPAGATSAAR